MKKPSKSKRLRHVPPTRRKFRLTRSMPANDQEAAIVAQLRKMDPIEPSRLARALGLKDSQLPGFYTTLRHMVLRVVIKRTVDGKLYWPRQHGTHRDCRRKTLFETWNDAHRYAARADAITGVKTICYRCDKCGGIHRATDRSSK